MKNEVCKHALLALITLSLLEALLTIGLAEAQENREKPIIVCTTNVLGSIVREFMGDNVTITVLVNPSLCPADYDVKPGDIYALSKAKILFYHDIPGEKPWLGNLIEAAGNNELRQIKVPGTYNTPEGAKNCIKIVGGNLSQVFPAMGLDYKMSEMLNEIDTVANEIRSKAQSLGISDFNVICMKWQKTFVEWVGFKVAAVYDPPEQLSASDIANLVNVAREKNVTLVIDNLQISTEFGASIASEVGAVHVVLTNFPGAIPETDNLARMFRYNAERLFDGLQRWKLIKEREVELKSLIAENESLKNQVSTYQVIAIVMIVVITVESIVLIIRGKRRE